ncbi:mercury transporter [Streptomyces sp. bgisy060]|uniref:mercury transporter n=1 Tax=Streptomyces sp. bgisy060 TaxID=3413775 RepID=UPI003EBFCAAD
MPATQRPPRRDRASSGTGTATAGIGLVLLMIACCALPALIAAGALAGIGAALGNPWVIAIAAFFLATIVTALVRRFRSGRGDCCPPEDTTRTKDREV